MAPSAEKLTLLVPHLADRIAKVLDVREAAIDRGEADVGHLVELAQLLHHHLAQPPRIDLALAQGEQLLLDARDGGIDEFIEAWLRWNAGMGPAGDVGDLDIE